MKIIVKAKGINNRGEMEREIEILDLTNNVGTLVYRGFQCYAHMATLNPAMAAKFSDKEIFFQADSNGRFLVADVTPKGQKSTARLVLSEKNGPACVEMADAVIAANRLVNATRDQLYREINAAYDARIVIPEGMVRVSFVGSAADGWIQIYKDAQGRELRSPKITGEKDGIAWMTQADYDVALAALEGEKTQEIERQEANLQEVIDTAKKLQDAGQLLTEAQRIEKEQEYDRIQNEGGEGYNPYAEMVTIEQYADAQQRLATIQGGNGL